MRSIFTESFIAAAVGLVVLVLSALFPALREQFEIIAPAVVVIVMTIVGSLLAESVTRTNAQTRVQIAQIEASAQGQWKQGKE